jgi:hypothetical protein
MAMTIKAQLLHFAEQLEDGAKDKDAKTDAGTGTDKTPETDKEARIAAIRERIAARRATAVTPDKVVLRVSTREQVMARRKAARVAAIRERIAARHVIADDAKALEGDIEKLIKNTNADAKLNSPQIASFFEDLQEFYKLNKNSKRHARRVTADDKATFMDGLKKIMKEHDFDDEALRDMKDSINEMAKAVFLIK